LWKKKKPLVIEKGLLAAQQAPDGGNDASHNSEGKTLPEKPHCS